MPTPTLQNLIVTWFPIREISRGMEELDPPICQETIPHRRAWTAERDLIAASTDTEEWRKPTSLETLLWKLDRPHEGHFDQDARWLVATTGEPGLGIPTRMAVRLQEKTAR